MKTIKDIESAILEGIDAVGERNPSDDEAAELRAKHLETLAALVDAIHNAPLQLQNLIAYAVKMEHSEETGEEEGNLQEGRRWGLLERVLRLLLAMVKKRKFDLSRARRRFQEGNKMGYQTSYTLSVSGGNASAIIEELRAKYEEAAFALSENGDTSELCKWYEHEEEVKEFSLSHPEVLFTLNGEGEESGDVWVEYFKNGKCQTERAVIQVAPFDESKLK